MSIGQKTECAAIKSLGSTRIPLLSFFTGAGFLDMGFLKAGFEIVWHNEYDPSFVRGFEYGMTKLKATTNWFPQNEACCKVQSTISIEDTKKDAILEAAFPQGVPTVFGVIGGPPCPDFSVGGKNRGATGDNGKLSQVYVDRILELQPTFFLFENVKGLLQTKKHRAYLDKLKGQLSGSYALSLNLLNALEFGAPQDRERMFLVGFRRDWLQENLPGVGSTEEWFPWPMAPFKDAKKLPWPDKSPFGVEPDMPDLPLLYRELMVSTWICTDGLEFLDNGREGFAPKSAKFSQIAEGDSSRKSFKRLHRYRYSPTVAYGNNEVHLHPTEARRLTVREALRLQTVPDEYALPPEMPLSAKFKTIGNGVPVRLSETIAGAFKAVLSGKSEPKK